MTGIASSNRVSIRQVKEVTAGTTPATPALKEVRWTSESLNYNLQNVTSNEIRSDRQTTDLIKTQSSAAGDLGFEMSFLSHDDFIIGALAANAFSTAVNIAATDLSAANADNSFNSSTTDLTAQNISAGQWIKVAGFTDAANNGYFRVVSIATNKVIVSGATLADEVSGDSVTIVGTMIRNGTDLDFFTIQKFLEDAETPTYFNMYGASVNTMSMNVQVGQPISGSFGLLAYGMSVTESQFSGATTPAAPSSDVMNAVDNIVNVQIDDTASTTCFNSLSLSASNNLRQQYCVGQLASVGIAAGKFDLTGSIALYFKNKAMYDKYVNSTSFSLSWRMQDSSGNAYVYTMPAVKFESGEVSATGSDQDMMFNGNYRAIRDATTGCMLQIDKFAA